MEEAGGGGMGQMVTSSLPSSTINVARDPQLTHTNDKNWKKQGRLKKENHIQNREIDEVKPRSENKRKKKGWK